MADATAVEPEIRRRDFLYIATATVGLIGAALTAWPFIDQMEPTEGTLAASGTLAVDLTKLAPGQQIVLQWQSKPIFVVRRTPQNLAALKDPALLRQLRDPQSRETQQPPYATNWSRALKPEYLVLIGICTHLGCIPGYQPLPNEVGPGWPGGWLCPCHGSKYDLAGRVYQNVPAPLNLPVPPYTFDTPTSLLIGENPPNESFTTSDYVGL